MGGRERQGPYRVLAGKPESKRLLGRSRQRWNDTIKIVGLEGKRRMDWLIWLMTGQVAGSCVCVNEPPGSLQPGGEFLD
jgi:hypothetical protein